MEDFIVLLMFVYPGAIAGMVYTGLSKRFSYYTENKEAHGIAFSVFSSAVIAYLTTRFMIPNGGEGHSLASWVELLKTSDYIWSYAAISLLIGCAFGAVSYGLMRLVGFSAVQHVKSSVFKVPTKGLYKSVWQEMISEPKQMNLRYCLVAIKKDGKVINAGYPNTLPDDFSSEKCLVLSNCELAMRELLTPTDEENPWIDHHIQSYYDAETGLEIAFYQATRYAKYILDESEEVTSLEREEPACEEQA